MLTYNYTQDLIRPFFVRDYIFSDGVVVPSFDPLLILPTAYYDASDTGSISHVSNKVTDLNDLSGNANHASQSTDAERPYTNTLTVNGLNALDPRNVGYLITPLFPTATLSTIFCVFKAPATFANYDALYGSHDNSNQRFYVEIKSNGGFQMGIGNSFVSRPAVLTAGHVHIFSARRSGVNTMEYYIDGVPYYTDPHSFSGTSANAMKLMARDFNATTNIESEFNSAWCAWFYKTESISDEDFNYLGNGFSTKWGANAAWSDI